MKPPKNFKKNLLLLQKSNPKLAYQLTMVDPTDLTFCSTEQGETNLKRSYQGQTYSYHSPQSANQEAQEWFNSLNLNGCTILYVYGVGLGYYYEAAKSWLKQQPDRVLIFLEEDLGVLHRLLETEQGTLLLKDPQVHLFYFQDPLTDKNLFNELSWTYLNCSFVVSCLKLYQEANPDGYIQLQHQLSYQLVQKKVFVEEYLNYGIVFFRNFYPNLMDLPKAFNGNGLFTQFQRVPAIICGAGPSLNKNLEDLKGLTDRALIFAGSSALNALIPKGILPHFGVAIDPNSAQYPRVAAAQPHQIPFFYRNRLCHEALEAISGPRLYLTGSGGYTVSEWFETELGIEGNDLDEGHNVVNFCIEIAHALGCDPIILVGVDLAFTNHQHYADGVATHLNLTEKDFKTSEDFDSQPLLKEDIHGQPISTLWKWITESEWITEFAHTHPLVQLINATEGGLGFKDVPNETLKETASLYLKASENLYQKVRAAIEPQAFSISSAQVTTLIETLQKSLDHCIDLLTALLQECQQLAMQIKSGLASPDNLQPLAITLLESDIEQEVAYQSILDTFNQIYVRVHYRQIQALQASKRKIASKKQALGKLALQKQRLIFLKDVARVNRELIQRVLTLKDPS